MNLPDEAKNLLKEEIKLLKEIQKKIKLYMIGTVAGGALQIMRMKRDLEDLLNSEILYGKARIRQFRTVELEKQLNKHIPVPNLTEMDSLSAHVVSGSFSNAWASAQISGSPFDWDSRLRRIVTTETARSYSDVLDEAAKPFHLIRIWNSVFDARTCKVCRDMDGETTIPGGKFSGNLEPGYVHVSCRCYSSLNLK